MGGGGSKEFVEAKALCKAAIKGAEGVKDKEDKVLAAFTEWDKDANGKISKSELEALLIALDQKITPKKVGQLLKAADKDKDGELNFEEMTIYIFQAPHLKKYFEDTKKLANTQIKEAIAMAEKIMSKAGGNPFAAMGQLATATEEMKKKQLIDAEKKLSPLIKKSFGWHDKDGSGVLEFDEGIIFFSNYAGFLPQYCKDVTLMGTLQAGKTMEKQMKKAMGGDAAKAMATQFKATMDEQLKNLDAVLDQKMIDYLANADDRQRAAWKVMDTNDDNKIQESEVLSCLIPGGLKNVAFMRALGIFVDPEDMQCESVSVPMEGDGCPQQ